LGFTGYLGFGIENFLVGFWDFKSFWEFWMANPSKTHQEVSYSFNGHMAATGENDLGAAPESSALKHKSGISLDWTLEEQAILEDGLAN
jgi:hypothetical protein